MCGTEIRYACSNMLISKSITCSCDRIIASGKSTLNCGTCDHPRCRELRGEVVPLSSSQSDMDHHHNHMNMRYSGAAVSSGGK